MRIACAFDHAGQPLHEPLVTLLRETGHDVLDLGTDSTDPVDYPDKALEVARAVLSGSADRGILACGSGAGVAIAASKVPGIRAACGHDTYTAHQSVEHDDVNVLCLGARVIGPALASDIVLAFVGASFTGEERHRRRLGKIQAIERGEGLAEGEHGKSL